MSHVSVPGIRALQETPCAPSSHHRGRPSSACHLPQRDMAAVELEPAGVEVQGAEVVVVAVVAAAVEVVIIGSTLTPACPTCSRALSKSTWTRCTSGWPTWQGPGTAADRDTDTDRGTDLTPTLTLTLTLTPTRIHTHTRINTGSHQLT